MREEREKEDNAPEARQSPSVAPLCLPVTDHAASRFLGAGTCVFLNGRTKDLPEKKGTPISRGSFESSAPMRKRHSQHLLVELTAQTEGRRAKRQQRHAGRLRNSRPTG